MANKPTKQQQRAIDAPHNQSTIVTAAAGSGKTTLLIGRIVRLLSDKSLGIPADSIAVMTFTRNAADSLRGKLIKKLSEKMNELAADNSEQAAETREYLAEQMISLRSATIGTIDSFCINVLKENVQAFDLPISFSIADSAKTASMQALAMQMTLKYFYEKDEDSEVTNEDISAEDRAALFYTFNFEDDSDLQNTIIDIANTLSSYADSCEWLDSCAAAYSSIEALEKRYINVHRQSIVSLITNAYHYLKLYKKVISDYDKWFGEALADTSKKQKELDKLKNDRAEIISNLTDYRLEDREYFHKMVKYSADLRKNPTMGSLEEFLSHTWEFTAPSMGITRKGVGNVYKSKFTSYKNGFKSMRTKLSEIQPFVKEEEEITLDRQRAAMTTLVKLLKKYMGFYRDIKVTSGSLDFSDCELMLLEKLRSDESFRRQLSDRYSCIIVDEFQDSNDVQAEIFRLISNGKNNLFYVGDIKQAIYTFRGGNPKIMAKLCRQPDTLAALCRSRNGHITLVPADRSRGAEKYSFSLSVSGKRLEKICEKHKRFTVIPLNKNFRSRRTIIDFVNMVFSGIMTKRFGDVDYEGDAKLVFGAEALYPEIADDEKAKYEVEVNMLNYPKKDASDDDSAEDDSGDTDQARFVADRIKSLVDQQFLITENGVMRPCRYSDFAIFLRSNGKMKAYKDALAELNIPALTPKGRDFLNSEEITLILNFLRVIDNPLCDEELLKVLMSPIYEISAEEMAEMRLGILGLPEDSLTSKDAAAIAAKLKGSSIYGCLTYCTRALSEANAEERAAEQEEDEAGQQTNSTKEDFSAVLKKAKEAEEHLVKNGVQREINPKAARFMNDLNSFRFYMSSNSIENLIRKIYDDTELFSIISTYEGSRQRLANIRLLQKYAEDFEEHEGGTLSDFLRFINNTKAFRQRMEAASAPEDAGNAVKIMTFHGSKGLEMPICIIAELNKPFMQDDCRETVVINHDFGMAMNYVDREARYKTRPFSYNAIHDVIYNGIFGEEMRLLYVAMTRAQEKLILVGNCKKSPNELAMIDGITETAFLSTVPFRWILASLLRYCNENTAAEFGKSKDKIARLNIEGANAAIYRHTEPVDPAQKTAELAQDDENTAPDNSDPELAAVIERNILSEYDNLAETTRQAKYSVTELAHSNSDEEEVVYLNKPSFMRNEGDYAGKEIGDAYHHLMEHFPIDEVKNATDTAAVISITEKAIAALAAEGKITEREQDILTSHRQKGAEKVARFFKSSLGQRMLNSRGIEREFPFYAELPARTLGLDHDGNVSLQGRTDMFFYEDDGIVLVDYKSDSLSNLEREKESYSRQLLTYKEILPKITGVNVKQMYLYAFSSGEEIDIEKYLAATAKERNNENKKS